MVCFGQLHLKQKHGQIGLGTLLGTVRWKGKPPFKTVRSKANLEREQKGVYCLVLNGSMWKWGGLLEVCLESQPERGSPF